MSDHEPVVVIDQLTKSYGEFTAVDNVSLTLDRGRILGFIGPNGAGKTTTIKILVGLAKPTSGSASIAGADCVRDARRIKRLVGYMPDTFGSYDNMRVREYLDFFGAAFGIPRKPRLARIAEVMETTNSTYMQDRYVETLSHGMKQRVGIARTLLHDPDVLVFDEPANGLDPEARIEMRELLLRLAEMGKTLIVTSHILPELSRICDQVAIIHQGKLMAFGMLDDILRQLDQRRMIEVQLASSDAMEQAVALLRETLQAETEINASQAESTIRFRTALDEAALSQVLAKLVQAGVLVTQFRELQTDLEDAFMTVTRGNDNQLAADEAVPAASSEEEANS